MKAARSPEERFWEKVAKRGPDECWLWTASDDGNGYGAFSGGHTSRAHVFSFVLHRGPVPAGMMVCHTCDVRRCVNPAHLFPGTGGDNQADMVRKGRSLRGERHNLARLSEAQVLDIRRLWVAGGLTQTEIGERFGVSKRVVSSIVRGQSWKHILPPGWLPPTPNRWSRV